MLASAPPEHYRRALRVLLADESIDSILTIFIPPLVTDTSAVAAAIADEAREAHGKPVIAVFMRSEGVPASLTGIPCYAFPEGAARALARVTAYGAWRDKPVSNVPSFPNVRSSDMRQVVDRALARGGGWLTDEAQSLMAAAGIRTAAARLAASIDDAVVAASAVGYPVALKAVGPTVLHKTERRAVCLNLVDAHAVRTAAEDLEARLPRELTGFLVQRMVPDGVEMLVGALYDPTFGPLVVCGSGGVFVDLLADSCFRLHPLTERDAAEMTDELRGVRLLRGYRGAPPADEAALRDVILRVSAMITSCPEIQELDLNPVKVQQSGACAVDVRVRVERQRPPSNARRVQY
jgi:acyl-CoA synthetase (NDP forming)